MKSSVFCVGSPASTADRRIARVAKMVLSVSGWRLCFAAEPDAGDRTITPEHRDIVIHAAAVFAEYLHERAQSRPVRLVLGSDTRPTGPVIIDTVLRTFLTYEIRIEWLGQVTTPEIIAYTRSSSLLSGFFYVTASHNPRGYNGFKFGLSDGIVLAGDDSRTLIERFRRRVADQAATETLVQRVIDIPTEILQTIERKRDRNKRKAAGVYRDFMMQLASGFTNRAEQENRFLLPLRRALEQHPIGIVGELNGSARATSIDRFFFPFLGVRTAFHNDKPGIFQHQILPEGAGLISAAGLLQEYYRRDPAFQVAYVPDNDGDRGNLVFIDKAGAPLVLEAQQVFALVVLIELAWLRYTNNTHDRVCVVANGPTSARIDEIARWFGAEVFRAEVGEANVVALAQEKRAAGWHVPILGEGSNGGNITAPATVRDPLSTLLALLKLYAFPLDSVIREACGEPSADNASLLSETVTLLPRFTTIETDDPRAKMQVGKIPHGVLKKKYEELLPRRIDAALALLPDELAVKGWRLWNHEGAGTTPGPGGRSGPETGGLRLVFVDAAERARATVWMRGSGTEPVFRILADYAGEDRQIVETLIDWQREVIEEAIEALSAG